MLVDLTKLILLLIGYALYGPPDDWDRAFSIQATIQFDSPSVRLELAYDPVAIYYRSLPEESKIGGYALGSFVVIDSDPIPSYQQIALTHELNHIWQARTYGLLVPLTYPTGIWEPNPYVWDNLNMPSPRQLNWSLFRIWIPLELR